MITHNLIFSLCFLLISKPPMDLIEILNLNLNKYIIFLVLVESRYLVKFVTIPHESKFSNPFYGKSHYFRAMSYYYRMSFRDPRNRSNKETWVDRGAIMSQFRVWPFLSTIIMTFGERNRNPGHPFKYYLLTFYLNNDYQYSVNFSLIKI